MKRLILLLSVLFLIFPSNIYALKEYAINDDFSNDLSNWEEFFNIGQNQPPCPSAWSIENDRLIARAIHPCTTNLLLKDSVWDDFGSEYIIEMDMWFIDGKDHNILLRFFKDPIQTIYSEFHFVINNFPFLARIHLDGIRFGPGQRYYYNTPNKEDPYHMKINFRVGDVELFIDGESVAHHTYSLSLDNFPADAIFGLRAGSGVGSSETHFDNVQVYKEIDPPFSYHSQIDPDWVDEQYDSIDEDIGDVGCALASATMLFDYYDLKTLPNGEVLGVYTLNQWLVENDGFSKNGGLYFDVISDLSRQIAALNPNDYDFNALEYVRQKGSRINFSGITSLLNADQPVIFKEKMESSPSGYHFDVATEVITEGSEYSILDPLHKTRTAFLMPPDELHEVKYFRPSYTDLSYLTIETDDNINFEVVDPDGNTSSQGENDIPESYFTYELPIVNYLDPSHTTGDPIWLFDQQYPSDGKYEILLSSQEDGWYEIWLSSMDEDGGRFRYKSRVFISKDYPTTLRLVNDSVDHNNTYLVREMSFDVLRSDIEALYRMGLIKKNGTSKSLLSIVDATERLYNLKPLQGIKLLSNLEKKIANLTKNQIEDHAQDLLLEDVSILKMSLQR